MNIKPSNKSEPIESFLTSLAGCDRREVISRGDCMPAPVGCGAKNVVNELRDDLSRKEYSISGMCQKCQDSFFGCDD